MASQKSPFDTETVRELAKLLSETDLTEIEVEKADLRIRVARQIQASVQVAAPVAPAPVSPVPITATVEASARPADNPNAVRSPMVGTAYRRATPESKPFVEIGSKVKEGDKVLLVEAMKTFNDIVAPRSGTVTQILVEDKQPVEYGEALIVIE
ncbi:MAG: acetyl-CoA carboxylase biotin carboxyl carrier protein [Beijerinckiaceae bacterium]|nr:acetyl-CoA carboxylase biotin carboxyl carrier protein [Beijerinckiaceae bacterium]